MTRHGVNVRRERVALLDDVADDVALLVSKYPRLLVQSGVLCGMRAQHRAEGSELHPAYIHLRIDGVGSHVSADVVAPVAVEHV